MTTEAGLTAKEVLDRFEPKLQLYRDKYDANHDETVQGVAARLLLRSLEEVQRVIPDNDYLRECVSMLALVPDIPAAEQVALAAPRVADVLDLLQEIVVALRSVDKDTHSGLKDRKPAERGTDLDGGSPPIQPSPDGKPLGGTSARWVEAYKSGVDSDDQRPPARHRLDRIRVGAVSRALW